MADTGNKTSAILATEDTFLLRMAFRTHHLELCYTRVLY